jgi:hypothetical protein
MPEFDGKVPVDDPTTKQQDWDPPFHDVDPIPDDQGPFVEPFYEPNPEPALPGR